jgi:hypothetical protein
VEANILICTGLFCSKFPRDARAGNARNGSGTSISEVVPEFEDAEITGAFTGHNQHNTKIHGTYHLIFIIGSVVFWEVWISKHPGDWQNASVPILRVISLTAVFWFMFDRRVPIT